MAKKQFKAPSLTIEELTAELYLSKKDLKKANDLLTAQEKARTELFANLSHDLRSPMTALRNSIDYLLTLDEYTTEELSPIFHLMQNRILAMETLINNLFLLTTLENTAIPFHYEPVDIGMFLEDFFFNCEADPKYLECTLILDVPLDMRAVISLDTAQFTRVLDNLFSNALKYSASGSSITLSALSSASTVTVTVTDTGIGMTEEQCQKVFERSYMASPARTPDEKTGCGLGLSIAKAIVERHNGTICCKSKPNHGTSFSIILPICQTEKPNFSDAE